MKTEKTIRNKFIVFAFLWSYLFWGISIIMSLKLNIALLENAELLYKILRNQLQFKTQIVTILNALAGYGPLLAFMFIYFSKKKLETSFHNWFKIKVNIKYFIQIGFLFLVITALPALALMIINKSSLAFDSSLFSFFLVFFFYQFITAATEEIGWRGFLLPSLLKEKTPWDASVAIGVIWALWHTPIILYVFYTQGLEVYQIILSFLGFIAGTIAMSTIHTYYYLKTKSVMFSMFIHAIANTIPMFVGMIFGLSYEISVAVQILLWAFVFYITAKNKVLFDTIQY